MVAELREAGYTVTGSAVDVATPTSIGEWVASGAAEIGGVDIVLANVGALAIPDPGENWNTSFQVDMMHTVRTVDAAMSYLERSSAGSIVTVSSVPGVR